MYPKDMKNIVVHCELLVQRSVIIKNDYQELTIIECSYNGGNPSYIIYFTDRMFGTRDYLHVNRSK